MGNKVCESSPGLVDGFLTLSELDVRVVEAPVPAITEPTDVIVRVTGTTVCGSDLHLFHKEIMQLSRGEILGHEFMGIVDEAGPGIKGLKKGDRVVASFQIAYAFDLQLHVQSILIC